MLLNFIFNLVSVHLGSIRYIKHIGTYMELYKREIKTQIRITVFCISSVRYVEHNRIHMVKTVFSDGEKGFNRVAIEHNISLSDNGIEPILCIFRLT